MVTNSPLFISTRLFSGNETVLFYRPERGHRYLILYASEFFQMAFYFQCVLFMPSIAEEKRHCVITDGQGIVVEKKRQTPFSMNSKPYIDFSFYSLSKYSVGYSSQTEW